MRRTPTGARNSRAGASWEEFTLAAIVIPANGDPLKPWELSYECRSDEHSFDVQMEGWTPQGVALNG